MTYRVRNIVIAIVLAIAAAMLSLFYVANYKRHVQHSVSTVGVYVAKSDIPVGTSGADIVKHHLMVTSQIAQRSVVPGSISNPDQVQNLVTTAPIYTGEQVTLRRFADNAELGPRAQLHGTLRAINIEGDPAQTLAGTVKPGDHVDMVATWNCGGSDSCLISRDVVRNVLVLQAPGATSSKIGTSQGGAIMLAASDQRQVQKIWWAVKNSIGWSLQLRPVTNAVDSPEDAESTTSMTKDGINQANLRHLNEGSPK
ncbi:MAG: Flp pilus assembly protein CpaB [Gaiellaceae bacterium]